MAVEIPLTGGLITQADPEEVGTNACTVLENADFTKLGTIRKRKGRGSASDTAKTFIALKRWHNVNISGNYYWIGIDSSGGAWYSTNLTSWTQLEGTLDIGDPSGKPYDGRIYDYNSQLRFSSDIATDAKIFQYIDRDFFWLKNEGTPGFYSDTARPRKDVLSTNITVTGAMDTDNWFYGNPNWNDQVFKHYTDTLNLVDNIYFYRYAYVFDGNQESELSDVVFNTSPDRTSTEASVNLTFTIATGSSLADWNKRITAINIYRSTAKKGTYYQIGAINTLNDDFNAIEISDAVKGTNSANSRVYLTGITTSADYDTKFIRVNGLYKKLDAKDGSSGIYELDTSVANNEWGNITDADVSGGAEVVDRCWNDPVAVIESDIWASTIDVWSSNDLDADSPVWAFSGAHHASYHDTNSGSMYDQYEYQQNIALEIFATSPELTVTEGATYYFEIWAKTDAIADGGYAQVAISTGTTGSLAFGDLSIDFGHTLTTGTRVTDYTMKTNTTASDDQYPQTKSEAIPVTGNGIWEYEKVSCVFTVPSGDNRVQIRLGQNATGTGSIYWVNPSMGQLLDYGKAFGGLDVYTSNQLGAINPGVAGNVYLLANTGTGALGYDLNEYGWIKDATQYAIQVDLRGTRPYNSNTSNTGLDMFISPNYYWREGSGGDIVANTHVATFFDAGLVNGVAHSTGLTSLNSKYKYSKFINGRNFVANVKIENDDAEVETHPNWVLFSEMSKPDVIPISNYIQISDAQGGEIVGLANLLGDLAVFMNQGIFRLSIPSTEPTAWSLRESEENIGCLSTESITEWEGGVFFAGHDHLYYMDSNFRATPVTASIKEDYQGLTSNETRTSYDPKRNKLLCRFGTSSTTTYILDLAKFPEENWSKEVVDSTNDKLDICVIDENSDIWSYSTTSQDIRKHDDSSTESTTFKRTTGWIKTPDLDTAAALRRLNLRYSSGADITIKIYIDGDSSTEVKTITVPANTSGNEWYKTKPGVRCRYFMLEISVATTTEDMEIRRLEVEFE